LNQANADMLMERFVSDYPTSAKVNQAFIEVAHYFDQGTILKPCSGLKR
jgi:hypothetical protein